MLLISELTYSPCYSADPQVKDYPDPMVTVGGGYEIENWARLLVRT